jgi:hypothetical protein
MMIVFSAAAAVVFVYSVGPPLRRSDMWKVEQMRSFAPMWWQGKELWRPR